MHGTTLVGIDLGKYSFHLHGQSDSGKQTLRKKVTRKQLLEFFVTAQVCTVVMEACAGAHYMARTLAAFGHTVKLISPQFVKPFVKSNKNDFVDAEAICEAAVRPAMRFVMPKTEAQQTLSALHRVRESLVQYRVKTINQIHGFLLEFGISLPVGKAVITRLPVVLSEHSLPPRMVTILERLSILKRQQYGRRSEQFSSEQMSLLEEAVDADLTATIGLNSSSFRRKPPPASPPRNRSAHHCQRNSRAQRSTTSQTSLCASVAASACVSAKTSARSWTTRRVYYS